MPPILDDIDLTNVEIAQALSQAAAIRSGDAAVVPWIQTEPLSLAEALTEAINLGVAVLGRDRTNPFDRSETRSIDVDGPLLELARFNAAILVVADFLCESKPVSSAMVAFGTRSKFPDVYEAFVGTERSLMLLAGMIPLAAAMETGNASSADRESTHAIALRVLEWSLAEYCAIAQLAGARVAAAA